MSPGRTTLAALLLAAAAPAAAWAVEPTFSIIATIPNVPVIGTWHGSLLFGITAGGGSNSSGLLFSLSPAGAYTVLHNFIGSTDGAQPNGRLVADSSGNIYGTTNTGGTYNGGTLWRYSPSAGFTVLHAFGGTNDGATPKQGPAISNAATLYGSTAGGAVNTNGMAFSLTSTGTYTALHDFLSGTDGHCPFSGVAHGRGNVIYGTTVGMGYGGEPLGSVWKIVPGVPLATIYPFKDGSDGEYPDQAPTVDAAGNVYGTTHVQKGNQFAGVIWKIPAGGTFSILHSFNAATDGFGPNSPLLLGFNGDLYGTTGSKGPGGFGTVFRITPTGTFTVLHSFSNKGDGTAPTGNLARDHDGYIYGGTTSGPVFKVHD